MAEVASPGAGKRQDGRHGNTCPSDVSADGLRDGIDMEGFVACFVATGVNWACADVNNIPGRDPGDVVVFADASLVIKMQGAISLMDFRIRIVSKPLRICMCISSRAMSIGWYSTISIASSPELASNREK